MAPPIFNCCRLKKYIMEKDHNDSSGREEDIIWKLLNYTFSEKMFLSQAMTLCMLYS